MKGQIPDKLPTSFGVLATPSAWGPFVYTIWIPPGSKGENAIRRARGVLGAAKICCVLPELHRLIKEGHVLPELQDGCGGSGGTKGRCVLPRPQTHIAHGPLRFSSCCKREVGGSFPKAHTMQLPHNADHGMHANAPCSDLDEW